MHNYRRLLWIIAILWAVSCGKDNTSSQKVYFFGDSHVNKWKLSYYLPDYSPINKGQNGARIEDACNLIAMMDSTGNSAVLLIGTNDFIDCLGGLRSEEEVIESFHQLIEVSRTKFQEILVINLLPLGDDFSDYSDYPLTYQHLSAGFEEVAMAYSNVSVLGVSALLSEDGYLAGYYTQDGVHLNDYGYSVLSSQTRSALSDLF